MASGYICTPFSTAFPSNLPRKRGTDTDSVLRDQMAPACSGSRALLRPGRLTLLQISRWDSDRAACWNSIEKKCVRRSWVTWPCIYARFKGVLTSAGCYLLASKILLFTASTNLLWTCIHRYLHLYLYIYISIYTQFIHKILLLIR